MLTYDVSKKGNKPLYIWLYENIRNDIENGNLVADEKLPSKRALAEHLKISIVTVQNTYAQLIAEGYLYSVEKKGYFVSDFLKNSIPPLQRNFQKRAETIFVTPAEKETEQKYHIDLSENSINHS